MHIRTDIAPADLQRRTTQLFELAGPKIAALHSGWSLAQGAPLFTSSGRYSSRSWTDWTLGFFVGMVILQFDATDDPTFLALGREQTVLHMAPYLSHTGVHDHGFNIVSTYGNLRRLMLEGRIAYSQPELDHYELALKISGAVQAARYTRTETGGGYIYSFNGPHSLFADTIRSLRSLALAHHLGHSLLGEADQRIDLLGRALEHAQTTARFNVYYGTGRDIYDVAGRVAHESLFNPIDGRYRCPSTQQGYSPFTTWTRGAAWIILGFAEFLEFVAALDDEQLDPYGGRLQLVAQFVPLLQATSDYYIDGYSCQDGIPFWDSGAPGLAQLGDYRRHPSDPFNPYEPVDSSAAAIAAQGLIRFGRYLQSTGEADAGTRYFSAGLTIAATLLDAPYLATDPAHQGLLLHALYHRPNGWDYTPADGATPYGEATLWGDYHLLELALLIGRLAAGGYCTFWHHVDPASARKG